MLRLLLLRHAKAAWPPGVLDADRPLAPRGQEAAALMGHYIKRECLAPDLALVSPARRTEETWEIVRPIIGEVRSRSEGRIYEAPVARLLTVLQEVEQKYPTAGLAVIDFPVESWAEVRRKSGRLECFVTPKSLGADEDD